MERCPCCNARLTGAVLCPRCQADLGGVLGSEQLARHWLNNAMQFWFVREPQMAILALTKAINFQQTRSALAFRDFITRQQCQKVLASLAANNYIEAEKMLGMLRDLNPEHEFIKRLSGFTEYLSAKNVQFSKQPDFSMSLNPDSISGPST